MGVSNFSYSETKYFSTLCVPKGDWFCKSEFLALSWYKVAHPAWGQWAIVLWKSPEFLSFSEMHRERLIWWCIVGAWSWYSTSNRGRPSQVRCAETTTAARVRTTLRWPTWRLHLFFWKAFLLVRKMVLWQPNCVNFKPQIKERGTGCRMLPPRPRNALLFRPFLSYLQSLLKKTGRSIILTFTPAAWGAFYLGPTQLETHAFQGGVLQK